MIKKMFVALTSLIIIGSLSYSAFLSNSMYEKFKDTIKWENSSLTSKIHLVPPALAKNYISPEDKKIFEVLTNVNIALEDIVANNGVKDEKYDEYWELHDHAQNEIENGMYKEMANDEIFTNFSLYLRADKALKLAYEDLNVESLQEFEKIFSDNLAKEDSSIEKHFLNEIREVAVSYKDLNDFSINALSQLGVVENKVLEVGIKVNKETSDNLLATIESKGLLKFPHIKSLVEILKGDSWKAILTFNTDAKKYYSWKESEKILDSLLKVNYVSISSFKSVKDVLGYSSSYPLETREGFKVNHDSKVTAVYHNGEKLSNNLYIKKGATLTFDIDYEYTEIPKSTITVQFLDNNGNSLDGLENEVYKDYVGNGFTVNKRSVSGYTLVEIKNNLKAFPESDSTIKLIYKKDEPKEEVKDEPEEKDKEVEEKPEPKPEPKPDPKPEPDPEPEDETETDGDEQGEEESEGEDDELENNEEVSSE